MYPRNQADQTKFLMHFRADCNVLMNLPPPQHVSLKTVEPDLGDADDHFRNRAQDWRPTHSGDPLQVVAHLQKPPQNENLEEDAQCNNEKKQRRDEENHEIS